MKIVDLSMAYLSQVQALAIDSYNEERRHAPALPEFDQVPDLTYFIENGMGVAAIEDDRLTGFLSGCEPFDNAFGTPVKGVFSPMHANAVTGEKQAATWQRLYQAAGQKWVNRGAISHGIALYAHNEIAQNALFTYAFGMRCMDAVRNTEPIVGGSDMGCSFRKITKAQEVEIRPLRKSLNAHLSNSPCFMYSHPEDFAEWLGRAETRKSQVYAAYSGEHAVAFYEVTDDGENFATEADSMLNICGAYCHPDFRGTGLAVGLLNFVLSDLRESGIPILGVDFESINPTANHFWNKHFAAYTHSVCRRIDEGVLDKHD